MTKQFAILAVLLTGLALSAGVYFAFFHTTLEDCSNSVVAGGQSNIGGPFTLVDQSGKVVTDKDVIDGLTLIYFGYTFCPDVCPLDNARNMEAIDLADEQGVTVKPVFISIDPERDTPEALADYAEVMHENMVALTGTQEQVAVASKAYRTYYRKNGEGEDYLMDHSTFTYLVAPEGFLDFFRRATTPEAMAETMVCIANTR
jgi:protein SCO1/2